MHLHGCIHRIDGRERFKKERQDRFTREKSEMVWRALSSTPVAYIEIRFFAHATEDVDKVVEAVQHVLPSNDIEGITFRRSNLRGHYGNPITLFEAKVKNKETIKALMENLSSRLSELDKETLGGEIHLYAQKGSLYLRLDKQAALRDRLKLCNSDPIRIRLRFRKKNLEDIVETLQKIGMLA